MIRNWLALAVVTAGLALAGCGSAAEPQARPVSGSVKADVCMWTIAEHAGDTSEQITVVDAAGKVVAVGQTAKPVYADTGPDPEYPGECRMASELSVPEGEDFYTVRVLGHETVLTSAQVFAPSGIDVDLS